MAGRAENVHPCLYTYIGCVQIPPPQECSRPTPGAYRADPIKKQSHVR